MTAVVAAVVVLSAGGCVGATSRADFTAEIRARGGGVTAALPGDALDAVGEALGVDVGGLELRAMSISPGPNVVRMEVRDPAAPANLDVYTWREGSLGGPEPVRLSADDVLDAVVFDPTAVAFDRIEAMADLALDEFGEPDGYVATIGVRRRSEQVVIDLVLESARASAGAELTAAGELIAVERR